jgi:hypothetical protein
VKAFFANLLTNDPKAAGSKKNLTPTKERKPEAALSPVPQQSSSSSSSGNPPEGATESFLDEE